MGYRFQMARNDSVNLRYSLCTILYSKRKFKGIVPQDFWLQVIFHESVSLKPLSKFAKVAKQLFVLNLQILGLNPQSQIRKFLRYASPQISFHWSSNYKSANFVGEPVRKLQIRKFFTIREKELNIFLKKFPPFIAKLSKSQLQVCLAEFFIW